MFESFTNISVIINVLAEGFGAGFDICFRIEEFFNTRPVFKAGSVYTKVLLGRIVGHDAHKPGGTIEINLI